MGSDYYDGGTTASATDGYSVWYSADICTSTGTATSDIEWVRVRQAPPRTILVEHPKGWTKKQDLAWVDLINKKTKTGWIIQMLISGDVLITDPNIEKRSMKDFVPLLKWGASEKDTETIDKFFEENSID